MKVLARRIEGFAHEVEIEGGHTITVDEPRAVGGTDTGPSPSRLVAASLASCVAVTIEMYAERKGWDVGAVEVAVDVEYEGFAPRSFAVSLRLPAELSDDRRQRLLTIATKCPVHRVLAGETPVSVSDRIEALPHA
ncbi:MAG TPA: OsmC family protein [Solirubrobacterales bacterium]|jgi:putative redox protein|nr:OsmC family protein [Solirubrobacterales bacterium]